MSGGWIFYLRIQIKSLLFPKPNVSITNALERDNFNIFYWKFISALGGIFSRFHIFTTDVKKSSIKWDTEALRWVILTGYSEIEGPREPNMVFVNGRFIDLRVFCFDYSQQMSQNIKRKSNLYGAIPDGLSLQRIQWLRLCVISVLEPHVPQR